MSVMNDIWVSAHLGAWDEVHRALDGAADVRMDVVPDRGNLDQTLSEMALFGLACARVGDRVQAQRIAKKLESLVENAVGGGRILPRSRLLCQAFLASCAGDTRSAQEWASKLKLTIETSGEALASWEGALACLACAKCLVRAGKPREGLRTAARGVRLALNLGLRALVADGLLSVGASALNLRKIALAQRMLGAAVRSYVEIDDFSMAANASLNRASWLIGLGQLKKARRVLRQVSLWATSNSIAGTAPKVALTLGWAQVRSGQLQEARQSLLRALRDFESTGQVADAALAEEYLLEADILEGKQEEAAARLAEIEKKYSGMLKARADYSTQVGLKRSLLLLASRRYAKAADEAGRWIRQASEAGLAWEEGTLRRVLGTALAWNGDLDSAESEFRAAWDLLSNLGEGLETKVLSHWGEALEIARKRRGQSGLGEELAFQVEVDSGSAVAWWLKHPLLGPVPWVKERLGLQALVREVESVVEERPQVDLLVHNAVVSQRSERPRVDLRRAFASLKRRRRQWKPSEVWWKIGYRTLSESGREVLWRAEAVAKNDLPVLILGPTGTGKELVARGLHALSGRTGEFVPVNCAAGEGPVFAGELHGVKKGAYTDAKETTRGSLEIAHEGTLFLDEVGDLGLREQGVLLRFLDRGEVKKLGAAKPEEKNVRVISATNRDLLKMVEEGKFREDLYYRLSGVTIRLPSLKERAEDFAILLEYLWEREGNGPGLWMFTQPDVVDLVKMRPWRGNIRELRDTVRLVHAWIREGTLEEALAQFLVVAGRGGGEERLPEEGTIRETEFRLAWKLSGESGSVAADILGISRTHAYRVMEGFGIVPPRARTRQSPALPS